MVRRISQYALLYVVKQPERSSAVSISFRLSLCRSLLETISGSCILIVKLRLSCFATFLSYSFIVLVIVTIVCIDYCCRIALFFNIILIYTLIGKALKMY